MKLSPQLDVIRHNDAALARAHREAAEAARLNPYFDPDTQRERPSYYLAQAEQLEKGMSCERAQ